MKKIYSIISNKEKKEAVNFHEKLEKTMLLSGYIVEPFDAGKTNVAVVIGGDGTLINSAKNFVGTDIQILAVNMGSLGFLTDVKEEEAFEMIKGIESGKYTTEEREFLEVKINEKKYLALNDMVIAKGGILSRMVRIKVSESGEYVNTYRADGIIISSPTGSTAYSLSAGGPIIKPCVRAMVITPIAPHTLNARPIVVGGDAVLTAESVEEHDDLFVTIDGQNSYKVKLGDDIQVSLSNIKIKLIKPDNRGYYSILREKLKWGESYAKRTEN